MSTPKWTEWVDEQLDQVRAANRWRSAIPFDSLGPLGRLPNGADVLSFSSNDYLGLTHHPAVIAASVAATERWGAGAGASRLIAGSRPIHHELEERLAEWRETEAALVYPTGFAANIGLLGTLGGEGCTIFSDELNHASIIDGCRFARSNGAVVKVYKHCDIADLHQRMEQAEGRIIVVTDSVFSMDGNTAPINELIELCASFGAMLITDEAHGVLEPVPHNHNVEIVQVGTLSKTLGALGGFIAARQNIIDLCVNRSRSWIFTTALQPGAAAAANAAVQIVMSPEGEALKEKLRHNVSLLRPGHHSPIIPIMCGTEKRAIQLSAALLEQGMFVPAIRPPTVPENTCRLRVALSASHTDEQISQLIEVLNKLGVEQL